MWAYFVTVEVYAYVCIFHNTEVGICQQVKATDTEQTLSLLHTCVWIAE